MYYLTQWIPNNRFLIKLYRDNNIIPKDIICFGALQNDNMNNDWYYRLSNLIGKPVSHFLTARYANNDICERIFSMCNVYKPQIIFIVFNDIDKFNIKSMNGESFVLSYDEIVTHTNINDNFHNGHVKRFEGINMLLMFVVQYRFISTYCNAKKIRFYCYIPSGVVRKLSNTHFKNYFLPETCLLDESGNLLNIKNNEESNLILATEFAKKI